MKRLKIRLLLLAVVLLAGCGEEKESAGTDLPESGAEEQQRETVPMGSSLEIDEGQQTSDDTEKRIIALEVRAWQDICEEGISAEEAMLNSARENFAYLAWSGNGETIYYSDISANKIYACTAEGEEKTCLYENAGQYLQVKDGWLYAKIGAESKTVKINCETGESVDVFTEPCGEHFFLQDALYIITEDGFCVLDEEDGSRVYCGQEFEVANVQLYDKIIFANAIKGEDVSFFMKGYLLGYDTVEGQYFLVKENALWPVAAGDWLSYLDKETNSRHVMNRVLREDMDLGIYAQYVACDGASLYYQDKDDQIYCWNGQEATALVPVEGAAQHFFLTPTHLYWMQTDMTWWFYDFESGKSGSL